MATSVMAALVEEAKVTDSAPGRPVIFATMPRDADSWIFNPSMSANSRMAVSSDAALAAATTSDGGP